VSTSSDAGTQPCKVRRGAFDPVMLEGCFGSLASIECNPMANADDDGSITHSFSFSIGPGQVRSVHDDAVAAFDEALEAVGSGGVNHFIDPRRIQTFAAGGPSVWSVATVPTDAGVLYLTYGWSGAIDPARSEYAFELSIVVPGEPTIWPALVLRALCRYMLGSGRALEVGQSMPFPQSITRFFAPPHEAGDYPDSEMKAALFADDPILPSIYTPRGVVNVRRVIGLYPEELDLMHLWSPAGFTSAIAARDPQLRTEITRPRYTSLADFVTAIEQGSQREGSLVPYVAVPGVRWESDDAGLRVRFPGGEHAQRIYRMLRARLPFGRHLLVHDVDPERDDAVVLEPGAALAFRNDDATLIVTLPADHALVETFAKVGDGPQLTWNFGA
jgi:hypothetical protein